MEWRLVNVMQSKLHLNKIWIINYIVASVHSLSKPSLELAQRLSLARDFLNICYFKTIRHWWFVSPKQMGGHSLVNWSCFTPIYTMVARRQICKKKHQRKYVLKISSMLGRHFAIYRTKYVRGNYQMIEFKSYLKNFFKDEQLPKVVKRAPT